MGSKYLAQHKSLSDFGAYSEVYDALQLNQSTEWLNSIACIVSSEHYVTDLDVTENDATDASAEHVKVARIPQKSPVVFLMISESLDIDQEEYMELVQVTRQQFRNSHPKSPVEVLRVPEDAILNLHSISQHKSGLEETEKNAQRAINDKMLLDAHNMGASDIHILCDEKESHIKFRIDGELRMYGGERYQEKLYRQISVMYGALAPEDGNVAGLSFNEREKLDGTLYRDIGTKRLGARIVSHSTDKKDMNFTMVLRVLADQNSEAQKIPFKKLGFILNQEAQLRRAMTGKGLTLIIGETNSGKSVTQQNILMEIDEQAGGTRKIVSIENPVEQKIRGVVQISLIDAGITSANAMEMAFQDVSSYLYRADPNDVAVGELRDKLTSKAALAYALSHNVMGTIHVDDPFDVFERLEGMEVDTAALRTGVLKTIVAQKLYSKLCPHCSLTVDELQEFTDMQMQTVEQIYAMGLGHKLKLVRFRNNNGCSQCNDGIKGRQMIAEIVNTDSEICKYLATNDKVNARIEWLKHGNYSKYDVALHYIFNGVVDPTLVIGQCDSLNHSFLFREQHKLIHPRLIYR
ncbi:GspE/PulE family protein [Vibrio sp. Hal054]|uniref:GspE/PulE family protein n=1 Tax=Vibrio sp. Hal054 TaxID=3035158 RepID=UPI00301DFE48